MGRPDRQIGRMASLTTPLLWSCIWPMAAMAGAQDHPFIFTMAMGGASGVASLIVAMAMSTWQPPEERTLDDFKQTLPFTTVARSAMLALPFAGRLIGFPVTAMLVTTSGIPTAVCSRLATRRIPDGIRLTQRTGLLLGAAAAGAALAMLSRHDPNTGAVLVTSAPLIALGGIALGLYGASVNGMVAPTVARGMQHQSAHSATLMMTATIGAGNMACALAAGVVAAATGENLDGWVRVVALAAAAGVCNGIGTYTYALNLMSTKDAAGLGALSTEPLFAILWLKWAGLLEHLDPTLFWLGACLTATSVAGTLIQDRSTTASREARP